MAVEPVSLAYWGMLLRSAVPDDAIAVARMQVRSWQVGYRSLLPDAYLDQLRGGRRRRGPWICHHSAIARTGPDRLWGIVRPLRGSSTLGPGYWRRPDLGRA